MATNNKMLSRNKVAAIILVVIVVAAAILLYREYAYKEVEDSDGDGIADTLDEFPGFNDEEFRITYNAQTFPFLTSMDPTHALVGNMVVMVRHIYESLVQFKGGTTEIIPMLARSWEVSPDGKTYTFQLREDVKFHDLTTFNATAVQFSYMRSIEIGGAPGQFLSVVESIDVIETYTVRFNLNAPYSPFLPLLASFSGRCIMSPTYVNEHEENGDLGREWMYSHEAGTGPYRLKEWIQEEALRLEWFPEYWGGWEPIQGKYDRIKKINFLFIEEFATGKEMIKRGDLDTIESVPPPEVEVMGEILGIDLEVPTSWNQGNMPFNTKKPPLDNKLVRQAICWGINYTAISQNVLAPVANTPQGPVPMGLRHWDPNAFQYYKNDTKAKELLAQAGYPEGEGMPTLEYAVPTGVELFRLIGEQLAADLRDIGVNLELKTAPLATWAELNKDPQEFADLFWPWINKGPFGDADAIIYPAFYSENLWPKGMNWGYFNNSELDELILTARTATEEERSELYKTIQSKISELAPVACVFIEIEPYIYRDWIHGRVYHPSYGRGVNAYDMWKAGVPGRGY